MDEVSIKTEWDAEAGAGYVRYSEALPVSTADVHRSGGTIVVDRTLDAPSTVIVDYGIDDRVVGIEIVGRSDETLSLARDYAAEAGLRWPPGFPPPES